MSNCKNALQNGCETRGYFIVSKEVIPRLAALKGTGTHFQLLSERSRTQNKKIPGP
jgi:hypothetical protein